MLKTEQPVQRASTSAKRPERVAWLVLLTSFGVFCLLCLASWTYVYRWWTQPSPSVVQATALQKLFVQVLPAGKIQPMLLQDRTLVPEDRVLVSPEAPPGPAASIQFGNATIALWAGTDLRVGQLQQMWSTPAVGPAPFELSSGQLLIELDESDEHLTLAIGGKLGGAPVVLASPGRYRVRILDNSSPTTAEAERQLGRGLEVATERGLARVGPNEIASGERLIEAGNRPQPKRNRWDLIRDGNFQQLVDDVYRQAKSTTWGLSSNPTVVGAADTGNPIPTQACTDLIARTGCEEPYLRLVRKGGNTKGYVTAVKQQIDADVTSYRWVRLRAEIKIVHQSLSKAGESGTECPLMIEITYSNTQAANIHKDYCYWAFEHLNQNGVVANYSYIDTTQIPPNVWQPINIELKQDVGELVKLESISIQANGHDYESQVRNVELFGEGLVEVPRP